MSTTESKKGCGARAALSVLFSPCVGCQPKMYSTNGEEQDETWESYLDPEILYQWFLRFVVEAVVQIQVGIRIQQSVDVRS